MISTFLNYSIYFLHLINFRHLINFHQNIRWINYLQYLYLSRCAILNASLTPLCPQIVSHKPDREMVSHRCVSWCAPVDCWGWQSPSRTLGTRSFWCLCVCDRAISVPRSWRRIVHRRHRCKVFHQCACVRDGGGCLSLQICNRIV